MLNNFMQYEYQPYHKIYTHEKSQFSLFLGDVSSALDMEFIKTEPINLVITAAKGMDQVSYPENQPKHRIYPLLDAKSQNIALFFLDFFDLVEQQILIGNILVHCAAGISRSATLVIAYLMKKFNWTFKEAIKFVRDKRPVVLPNLGFQRQLKEFQIALNKNNNKEQQRIAQSSQFEKRTNFTKNDNQRKGLFSPIKRQALPGIKCPTTIIRSKELQKNTRFVPKDYIVEIVHRQINSQIRKSGDIINKSHNVSSKQTLKKTSARPVNINKDLLIQKIESGRTKLVQRSAHFDPIRSPNKNQRNDTFYEPEFKIKKLSSLSHRSEMKNRQSKIPRNYSNNSRRGNSFLPLYDQVNHVVVSKLQLNQRRFVTEKQLRSRGIQRLIQA